MIQKNKIIDFIQNKWLLSILIFMSIVLFVYAFKDIVIGDMIMKDLNLVYKDITASFFSLLLLKNSALIFLLVFFISEYKVHQRQYLQYKFKKNVAYNITIVEDRLANDIKNKDVRDFSFEVYKDIVYKEPQLYKDVIKKENNKA